jgi:antitoxin component of MazEF toxin-antitoxin module
MDIRNVQKTGNMHYVYLPTAWCKKNKLTSQSKVSTVMNEDSTLTVSPELQEGKKKQLVLRVKEDNLDVLHKLIIASYLTPAAGFKIILDKPIDYTKLLDKKKLISLELVELNKGSITCESSLLVDDVGSLLKTMIRKIRNMLTIMMKNHTPELIGRYEEEIDRNQLLLDKSITEAFTFHHSSQLKTIELYYISLMSKELERLVDVLYTMKPIDTAYIQSILTIIDYLKDVLAELGAEHFAFTSETAIGFIKKVDALETIKVKDVASYEKKRAKELLVNVSEVLVDWALFYELDKTI